MNNSENAMNEFKKINNSIVCKDLLGCDLNEEELRKYTS